MLSISRQSISSDPLALRYTNHDKPKLKFVNQDQHPGSLVDTDDCAASPSGTWNSVIDNQADIIKKSEAGDPVWAVAEAEEVGSLLAWSYLHSTSSPHVRVWA